MMQWPKNKLQSLEEYQNLLDAIFGESRTELGAILSARESEGYGWQALERSLAKGLISAETQSCAVEERR